MAMRCWTGPGPCSGGCGHRGPLLGQCLGSSRLGGGCQGMWALCPWAPFFPSLDTVQEDCNSAPPGLP